MHLILTCLILAPFVIIGIIYVLSLSKLLARISPENRSINPGLTWLLFIPFLNFIWHFVLVLGITNSTEKEFIKMGINKNVSSARTAGILASISWPLPLIINTFFDRAMSLMILLTMLISIIGIIAFIVFWVKTSSFNRILKVHKIFTYSS